MKIEHWVYLFIVILIASIVLAVFKERPAGFKEKCAEDGGGYVDYEYGPDACNY